MELYKGWSWKSSATPGKCPSESSRSCRWDSSNSEPHSTVFWILWLFGKYLLAFSWRNTFVKAKFLIIKPLLQLGSLGHQIYICKHPHTPHQLSVLHLTLKDSFFSPTLDSLWTCRLVMPLHHIWSHWSKTPLLLTIEHVRVITLKYCTPSLWINQGFNLLSRPKAAEVNIDHNSLLCHHISWHELTERSSA